MICVTVWNRAETGIVEERYYPNTAIGMMKARDQRAEFLARYTQNRVELYETPEKNNRQSITRKK